MNHRNHGGTAPPVAALQQSNPHNHIITTQSQINSIRRLYAVRPVLTINALHDGLRTVGFEHVDKVNITGNGRMPARGKAPNNTGAAYLNTSDGQACHWVDFTIGDRGTIFAGDHREYDPAETAKQFEQARIQKLKAESQKLDREQKAAQVAKNIWHIATPATEHDYITRKGLHGLHGAKLNLSTGALVVPMWVSGMGLMNLQSIYPDGSKRFLARGRVAGAYGLVGSLNQVEKVLVCEGWATAATVHEKTGLPVVIAFNAGNLPAVCQCLRARFTNIEVVVCGDDDRRTLGNPGRTKAVEAAKAIGAKVTFPDLCLECDCTDFNDQANCIARGAGVV